MEEDILLNNFISKSYYYRGLMLNEFINLEKTIESVLSNHFFGYDPQTEFTPGRQDFQSVILDRMTFEAKRASLKYLNEKRQIAKGFVKTKSNRFPNNELFNEIRLLNDERNRFAHYYLIKPQLNDKAVLGLAEFRDNSYLHTYTVDDINKILFKIVDVRSEIYNLFRPE